MIGLKKSEKKTDSKMALANSKCHLLKAEPFVVEDTWIQIENIGVDDHRKNGVLISFEVSS